MKGEGLCKRREGSGGEKILQDFISFPPARCCPVKAGSQPAARELRTKKDLSTQEWCVGVGVGAHP